MEATGIFGFSIEAVELFGRVAESTYTQAWHIRFADHQQMIVDDSDQSKLPMAVIYSLTITISGATAKVE